MSAARRLDLKVGFACNNRCVFCAQGDKRERLPAVDGRRLLAELLSARAHASSVVFTGGEPTVHKRLVSLVKGAKLGGYRHIQIQSNGRLLSDPARLTELIEAGASEFALSLHGPRAEVHDALTRTPGSFEQTVNGIRNVVARGVPLLTNTVITRTNLAYLADTVNLLGELGARHLQLAFVHPVGTAYELFDEVVPRLADVVEPLRRARERAQAHEAHLVTEAIPLCFLRGMAELAVEGRIPPTTVVDLGGASGDYTKWRIAEGKAYGPPCNACQARHRCEGPWREYPDKRGWGEFEPL